MCICPPPPKSHTCFTDPALPEAGAGHKGGAAPQGAQLRAVPTWSHLAEGAVTGLLCSGAGAAPRPTAGCRWASSQRSAASGLRER